MANLSYILTLQSEGAQSGPYYEATFITGAYFTPVVSGSPAYLPNPGSTATVVIPSGSYSYLAFKLRGADDPCEICYSTEVVYTVTGSAPVFTCCTGSILTTALSASVVNLTYNSGTGASCYDCSFITFQTSSNGLDFGGDKTGSCGVSQSVTFTPPTASCPATTIYYRAQQTCTTDSGNVTSSYWVTSSYTGATASVCCTPSITNIEPANPETSSLTVSFSSGSDGCCINCVSMSIVSSSNGTTYGSEITLPCTASSFTTNAPTEGNTLYFKIYQTCSGSVTSSFSAVDSYTYPSSQTLFEFTGCGRGNTVGGACSDAANNNRTFVSDCDTSTFGVGCVVYTNPGGTTLLTGFDYVFMNGAVWEINSVTGVITAYSSTQC